MLIKEMFLIFLKLQLFLSNSLLKFCPIYETVSMSRYGFLYPVDTGRTLNVYKTFRRCPGRLRNVLCTFNLRSVSTGKVTFLLQFSMEKSLIEI